MKKQFTKYYIILFFLFSNLALFAQQPGSGNGTGDLEGTDAPAVSINDYLLVLALAGFLFVYIKLNSNSKKMLIN